jgi:hypothetical protein
MCTLHHFIAQYMRALCHERCIQNDVKQLTILSAFAFTFTIGFSLRDITMIKTIQLEEPTDPEEGEHLFHSQMWVKGTPLHFIVDSGSHKNLISKKVIK